MQFSAIHTSPPELPSIIIPLMQDDYLEGHLNDFTEGLGLDGYIPFKGKAKEVFPIFRGKTCYFLLGLGSKVGLVELKDAFSSLVRTQKNILSGQLGINTNRLHLSPKLLGEAIANGMILGQYTFEPYKTENKEVKSLERVWVQNEDIEALGEGLIRGKFAGETQCQMMDLMNAPANKMKPQHFADWAVQSARDHGYLVEVFDKKALEALKMHAVLSVAQGSASDPLLIVAQYAPADAQGDIPHIGLVGKGVTYDTGGLSIKTSNMHYMKSDMGGGVAVLGALELAAKWRLPIRLTAVVPAVENDVDARSTKPGDVIDSFSGKTIEVIDTDAEGRLVLADGLSFLTKEYHPDVLIDAATLTGNSVMALGYCAGALMSNDDELANQLQEAGQQVGERVWRMPIWEEYGLEMKSDIADIRNYSERPLAGSITAAKFIENFINEHPKWAHMDIAGVAFGNTEYGKQSKGGTAFGARLLVAYFEKLIQDKNYLLHS